MKVLVVSQYFWPENFRVNDLCQGLIDRGHEVTVLTGLPNYPEGELYKGYSFFQGPYTEAHEKIKIIRVPLIPRGKNKSLQLLVNFVSFFVFASILAPFRVNGKFDKIFVYEPSPITVVIPAIVLRFIKKAPIFFWVQDLWPESLEATGVVKNTFILSAVSKMVRVLYKFSDRILVTSKGFIPRVKNLGVPEGRIIYFPQWAEAIFNNEADKGFTDPLIPENGFCVMFAGNIGSSQDFGTIVKAAEILKENKNIYFLILGDGMMRTWAQGEIARLKLQDNFIFLGKKPVEMMPNYYSKADVLLMTLIDTELFSITVPAKIATYLASSKPVLASINGEGANVVTDAKAGLAVPASRPELLAQAILKLSGFSEEELSELGQNGRKYYENEFEREGLISFLESKFEEVTL